MRQIRLILLLTALVPLTARAQWSFDVVSVEAYINDHKTQRSLLLARSTLEESNRLLHSYSSEATEDYRDTNLDLDKYTRAFDVIDVLYQTLRTALNARTTYNSVTDRIGDYKDLLEDYTEKVLARKGFSLADTALITINSRAIELIAGECTYLYKSLSDLVLYASGAANCSAADLVLVLNGINDSMDRIERDLNRSYLASWRYIQLRMGYWKEKVYRTKTKRELADEAFSRWRASGDVTVDESSSSGSGIEFGGSATIGGIEK